MVVYRFLIELGCQLIMGRVLSADPRALRFLNIFSEFKTLTAWCRRLAFFRISRFRTLVSGSTGLRFLGSTGPL